MLDQARTIDHLHFKVNLSPGFKLEVQWWLQYLPLWNGKCMLFYKDKWATSTDMHLYIDASDLAASEYFRVS